MATKIGKRQITALMKKGHPRMIGERDVNRVRHVAETLPKDATIVELGPWLGVLSVELAGLGNLHVVDNFKWTKDHNRRVPDVIEPGHSFRPLFEGIMSHCGANVTIHEADFAEFEWTDGKIDMLVIDSPKSADALLQCFLPVVKHLSEGGHVLIKNGLNPQFHDMMAYVDRLVSCGVFESAPSNQSTKSNVLALTVKSIPDDIDDILEKQIDAANAPAQPATTDSNGPYEVAQIIKLVEIGEWSDAYDRLSLLVPDPANTQLWERLEPTIDTSRIDPSDLGLFSEIFAIQNDTVAHLQPVADIKKSAHLAMRAYWLNNADKAWRGKAFAPRIIERAFDFGYMSWPRTIQNLVKGKDILDIGCGPGLHGIGYLVLGANSYVGVDPIAKPNKDRAKNLTAKRKEPFGWTPNQIHQQIPPWQVTPLPLQSLDKGDGFDLAVLHNVTEHLSDLEGIFEAMAERLRPDGKVVYNHHNFYAWNGHHLPPKTVSAINLDDAGQREMIDWGHVEFDPPEGHYIGRGLNRIRLDDIIDLTHKYFDVEEFDERPSRPDTGLGRLNDKIRERYPYLTDRDFETQNLFCIARKKKKSAKAKRA